MTDLASLLQVIKASATSSGSMRHPVGEGGDYLDARSADVQGYRRQSLKYKSLEKSK